MRWREGDRGREGAEIISRKLLTQSDSWRLEPLFKVKLWFSEQKLQNIFKSEQMWTYLDAYVVKKWRGWGIEERMDYNNYVIILE